MNAPTLDDLLSLVRARVAHVRLTSMDQRSHGISVALAFADLFTCAPPDRARYGVALAAAALAWSEVGPGEVPCRTCNGKGSVEMDPPGPELLRCPACKGKGR